MLLNEDFFKGRQNNISVKRDNDLSHDKELSNSDFNITLNLTGFSRVRNFVDVFKGQFIKFQNKLEQFIDNSMDPIENFSITFYYENKSTGEIEDITTDNFYDYFDFDIYRTQSIENITCLLKFKGVIKHYKHLHRLFSFIFNKVRYTYLYCDTILSNDYHLECYIFFKNNQYNDYSLHAEYNIIKHIIDPKYKPFQQMLVDYESIQREKLMSTAVDNKDDITYIDVLSEYEKPISLSKVKYSEILLFCPGGPFLMLYNNRVDEYKVNPFCKEEIDGSDPKKCAFDAYKQIQKSEYKVRLYYWNFKKDKVKAFRIIYYPKETAILKTTTEEYSIALMNTYRSSEELPFKDIKKIVQQELELLGFSKEQFKEFCKNNKIR